MTFPGKYFSKENIDSLRSFNLYLFCSHGRSKYMGHTAKQGDTVRVNYTGKSEDGSVFESSVGLMPLKFTIGSDEVVSGFEDAIIGMHPGEKKTVVVQPEDGFGLYDENLVFEVPNEEFPDGVIPQIGMDFEMVDEDGYEISAVVIEISKGSVTIDANAPLAGKAVIYDIELVEIIQNKNILSTET
jgi:peptidylprolyl isomerase